MPELTALGKNGEKETVTKRGKCGVLCPQLGGGKKTVLAIESSLRNDWSKKKKQVSTRLKFKNACTMGMTRKRSRLSKENQREKSLIKSVNREKRIGRVEKVHCREDARPAKTKKQNRREKKKRCGGKSGGAGADKKGIRTSKKEDRERTQSSTFSGREAGVISTSVGKAAEKGVELV